MAAAAAAATTITKTESAKPTPALALASAAAASNHDHESLFVPSTSHVGMTNLLLKSDKPNNLVRHMSSKRTLARHV
jgi:hypothetical protein